MSRTVDAADFSPRFRLGRAELSDLTHRSKEEFFRVKAYQVRQSAAELLACIEGWEFKRWPEDSPAWRRKEKIRRVTRRFKNAYRVLVNGWDFEDYF